MRNIYIHVLYVREKLRLYSNSHFIVHPHFDTKLVHASLVESKFKAPAFVLVSPYMYPKTMGK